MFKKALQIIVTLSLLLGGYAGYTRLFLVISLLLGQGQAGEITPFPEKDANSLIKATRIARETLGTDHWASQDDLKLSYIEESRGYLIYAQDYELANERKQLILTPFAMVWISADGRSHKTATSDKAILDMSGPFGNLKPGSEPSKIVHARLIGNVKIRDDKGTRDDPTDDLRVSEIDQLDYDEPTLQITSQSNLFLEDRNFTLTGVGLLIQLRRKMTFIDPTAPPITGGGGMGFDAEYADVYKDVHIVGTNVTSNGILPGNAKPEKTGNTPIDLRSREMRIVLPRPRPTVKVGPPDLNRKVDPTLAFFKSNVVVIRGTDKTDQLNCDTLDLILMPKPKPPGSEAPKPDEIETTADPTMVASASATKPGGPEPTAEAAPKGSSGPLTDLKLEKAIARGDAVWIQSEMQGLNARCVELIHEKHDDGTPDFTYLNGGTSKRLWVERTEYDLKAELPGTIKSVMVMKAQDATIFDYGPGGTSRVIARGPGRADERPARNAPIQRTVYWEDEMELITWRDGEGVMPTPHVEAARAMKDAIVPAPPKGTLRRVITLTGVSKLVDHGKPSSTDPGQTTTLDARRSIVAEFQAGPKLDPKGPDGPNEIKWLNAYQDAHLTAPSKTLTARRFLIAKFVTPPAPAAPATPAAPAASGAGPVLASAPSTAPPEPQPTRAPAPPEPAVDGRADRIWADLILGSGNMKSELKHAYLRGGVMVHQEPAPGKKLPNDATGEAIDLTGQGNGLMKFAVKAEEPPQATDPRTKLASNSNGRRIPLTALARVEFEGKVIESQNIIGLDQKLNYAWVDGAGVFSQMTERGLLDDKGIAAESGKNGTKSGGPTPMDKLIITWNDQMRFIGTSKDLDGRPVAKIEFRGTSKEVRTPDGKVEFRRGVDAKMTESHINCDSMDVYMDRTINLTKDTSRKPKSADDPPAPDPQIAMLDCTGKNVMEKSRIKYPGVVIVNEKTYPGTRILKEKQRIEGVWVVYDKRSGEFEAPGPGTTWLYQRDGGDDLKLMAPTNDLNSLPREGKKLIVVAPVRQQLHFRVFDAEGKRVVDGNERNYPTKARAIDDLKRQFAVLMPPHELSSTEKDRVIAQVTSIVGSYRDLAKASLPPLKLTKVQYFEGMQGRFGVARDQVEPERREALFLGSAQAANATVLSGNGDLDFDKPNAKDYVFLTSDQIHVFSYPQTATEQTKQLLFAQGNSVAHTIDSLITADRITYDSSTELMYAYGEDDKLVSLTKQDSRGQPSSAGRGKTLRFNKATRASDFNDPQFIQFVDVKSGFRPKAGLPEFGGSPRATNPPKQQRMPFQRTQRSSTERQGFRGS